MCGVLKFVCRLFIIFTPLQKIIIIIIRYFWWQRKDPKEVWYFKEKDRDAQLQARYGVYVEEFQSQECLCFIKRAQPKWERVGRKSADALELCSTSENISDDMGYIWRCKPTTGWNLVHYGLVFFFFFSFFLRIGYMNFFLFNAKMVDQIVKSCFVRKTVSAKKIVTHAKLCTVQNR